MRKVSPKTRIKRRTEEIKEILQQADEDRLRLVQPLIEQTAHMEVQLEILMEKLEEEGFVETYKNGENQYGTKESTVSKAYSSALKGYISTIRTIIQCLPVAAQQDAEDALTDFIKARP